MVVEKRQTDGQADRQTGRQDAMSKVNFHVLSKNSHPVLGPCLLSRIHGQITRFISATLVP